MVLSGGREGSVGRGGSVGSVGSVGRRGKRGENTKTIVRMIFHHKPKISDPVMAIAILLNR
jgi:hypothetical protein